MMRMEDMDMKEHDELPQLPPTLVFNPKSVENRLKEIVTKHLQKEIYDDGKVPCWIKTIIQDISEDDYIRINHYKRIVQVSIIRSTPETNIHTDFQCFYDEETDAAASYSFENDSIICTAVVFAVFSYNIPPDSNLPSEESQAHGGTL